MAKPSMETYQRLLKKVIREMALMRPGNDARIAVLNKKFAKYDEKIKTYGTKK